MSVKTIWHFKVGVMTILFSLSNSVFIKIKRQKRRINIINIMAQHRKFLDIINGPIIVAKS